MRVSRVKLAIGVAAIGVVATGAAATAHDDRPGGEFRTFLTGYEEVPALSTPGVGSFRAAVSRSGDEIAYVLRYSQLPSAVTAAHIHFENRTNNGPVVAFLCANGGTPPAGTPACDPSGTVRGTIRAAQVTGGGADQGLAAGELGELIAAMRAGATYVNVHTADRPAGEIRGQIDRDHGH